MQHIHPPEKCRRNVRSGIARVGTLFKAPMVPLVSSVIPFHVPTTLLSENVSTVRATNHRPSLVDDGDDGHDNFALSSESLIASSDVTGSSSSNNRRQSVDSMSPIKTAKSSGHRGQSINQSISYSAENVTNERTNEQTHEHDQAGGLGH